MNTSTVPSWKLDAYRNVLPSLVLAIARPLYTAVGELNTSEAVDNPLVIGSAVGFHAVIWPDSEEKMNPAGPLPALLVTTNPGVELATCPVGLEPSPVDTRPPGMFTVSPAFVAVAPPGGML